MVCAVLTKVSQDALVWRRSAECGQTSTWRCMGLEVVGVLKSRPFLPSSAPISVPHQLALTKKASWQVTDELVASFEGIQQDPYVCRFPSSRSNHSMFNDMGLPVWWSDVKSVRAEDTCLNSSRISLEYLLRRREDFKTD